MVTAIPAPDIGGQKHHQPHILRVEPGPRQRRQRWFNDKGPTAGAGGFCVTFLAAEPPARGWAAAEWARVELNDLHMYLYGAVRTPRS